MPLLQVSLFKARPAAFVISVTGMIHFSGAEHPFLCLNAEVDDLSGLLIVSVLLALKNKGLQIFLRCCLIGVKNFIVFSVVTAGV